MSVSRIVVSVDGSEASGRAVPVAAALASQLDVPMTCMTVAVHPDHVPTAEQILRDATASVERPVECEVVIGDAAGSRIVEYFDDDRSALAVLSTHARHAVGELVLGSVADEVVRRSAVPVVLVGPQAAMPQPGAPYRDLIVCVDGRPESEELLPLAATLRRELHVHPWLFQVVDPDGVTAIESGDVLEVSYVHRLASHMDAPADEIDYDVGHDRDRAEAILRFAETRSVPLIAVATHGRHPLDRLSSASVTVGVARGARCPVIVIGPAYRPTIAAR
jgi:nucleotide-binding universal stress UspA family protein